MKKAFLIFFAALFFFSGCDDDNPDVKVGYVVIKDNKGYDFKPVSEVGSNTPIGVVFSVSDDYALAFGLKIAESKEWATDGAGTTTNYEAIVCTPSTTMASSASFSGDTDGSDNFSAIKNVTKSDSTDFPAFDFAESYTAADGSSGWYVPSVAELATLFKNKSDTLEKDEISELLQVVEPSTEPSDEQNNSEDSSQEPQIFWTSSIKYPDVELSGLAECIKFDTSGQISLEKKTEPHSVLVIRKFRL